MNYIIFNGESGLTWADKLQKKEIKNLSLLGQVLRAQILLGVLGKVHFTYQG